MSISRATSVALLWVGVWVGWPPVARSSATAGHAVVSEQAVPCLNIRATPAASGARLDCLEPGQKLELASDQPPDQAWVGIRLADGRAGWAARAFLASSLQQEPETGAFDERPKVPSETDLTIAGPVGTIEPTLQTQKFVRLEPFEFPEPSPLAVRRGRFRQRRVLTGELRATRSIPITVPRTRVWNVQIRWMAEDGAVVEEGEPLIEFDNSSLLSELEDLRIEAVESADELARAEVKAEGQRGEVSLALERARTEYEKARIAAEVPEALLSAREFQSRQLELRRAEVGHEKAREELQALERSIAADIGIQRIALEKVELQVVMFGRHLELLQIAAPSSGIVLTERHAWEDRKFRVSDTVWPGMVVLSLPDLNSLEVGARLMDVDDGKITVGMPAICRIDAYSSDRYACRVKRITPVAQGESADSSRRFFQVDFELERTVPERMRPGMSVQIEVASQQSENVLLAARASLDLSGDPPRALLAGGDEVEVELGACNAVECVVVRGLEEGARLGRVVELSK